MDSFFYPYSLNNINQNILRAFSTYPHNKNTNRHNQHLHLHFTLIFYGLTEVDS